MPSSLQPIYALPSPIPANSRFVQSTACAGSSGTSPSATLGSMPQTGNALIAIGGRSSNASYNTVTGGGVITWTRAVTVTGNACSVDISIGIVSDSPSTSVTFTGTGNWPTGTVIEVSRAGLIGTFLNSTSGLYSSNPFATGTLAATKKFRLAVFGCKGQSGGGAQYAVAYPWRGASGLTDAYGAVAIPGFTPLSAATTAGTNAVGVWALAFFE